MNVKKNGWDSAGIKNGNAKLTESQVSHIKSSNAKATVLARMFSVHFNTIYKIRNGERWGSYGSADSVRGNQGRKSSHGSKRGAQDK